MILEFPPAFDLNYYRRMYPELNYQPDEVVIEHYRLYAEEQGRTCCTFDRSEKLRELLNKAVNKLPIKLLEIGPFDNPSILPPEQGEGTVKYFDIFDSAELQQLATKTGRKYRNTPKKIDYVSPNGDLTIVDETFDIVFSSHSIEHQMNLIKHFQLVENILNDGGLYVMVVPDKRFCFDHFRQPTSITEVLAYYCHDVQFRPFFSFIDCKMMETHNSPIMHWFGMHGDAEANITPQKFEECYRQYKEARAAGRYIDCHSLCFTPYSFEHLIKLIKKLRLTNFNIHRICHTVWGRVEFTVVLKKN